MIKTKFLTGDVNWKEYGGKFVTKKFNNGEFDYYLVIDFINMHDATGDTEQDKYQIIIGAVKPKHSKEKMKDVLSAFGLEDENPDDLTELQKVMYVYEYGLSASLYNISGNNAEKLLKEARKELQNIPSFFGFYMDKQMNAIGNTGWDFIDGNIGFKTEV